MEDLWTNNHFCMVSVGLNLTQLGPILLGVLNIWTTDNQCKSRKEKLNHSNFRIVNYPYHDQVKFFQLFQLFPASFLLRPRSGGFIIKHKVEKLCQQYYKLGTKLIFILLKQFGEDFTITTHNTRNLDFIGFWTQTPNKVFY